MRLGLGTYAFRWAIGLKDRVPPRAMTAFDVLDAAADYGFAVVQYADNMPIDRLDASEQDRLADAAREAGIALELGTQSFDAEEVARYIRIGRRIDARILRVALDAADAGVPVPDLARRLRPQVARAREANMRIAIENHFNYPSPRLVDLLGMVDDPGLGICLDVANSICALEWPVETVRLLAPHAINLHLKDFEITPDTYGVGFRIHGVPLGEGRAPIPWILDQLAHCPPDTSVILEHWLPDQGDLAAARALERPWLDRSLAAARRYMKGRTV